MILNDKLSLTPSLIYENIKTFFDNKYDDIICDQDENRKSYNLRFFKSLKKDFLQLIISDSFWKYSMNYQNCVHKYKSGKLCNKRIYITPDTKEFKCGKHISKKIYISTKNKNKDISLFCISLNNTKKPCMKYKMFGDYCNYHITRYQKYLYNIENDIYYLLFYDINLEINLFNNINIENVVDSMPSVDGNISETKPILYQHDKFINIKKSVNDLYKNIYQFNEDKKVPSRSKNILDIKNVTVKDCLNGGAIIVNDKEYLKDISVYDIYNGKKINTNKLINYYNKIKKVKEYIVNNKKYIYLKNKNKNRCFYIKEEHINILLEYINTRYNDLYNSLSDFEPSCWLYLLEQYKLDIDSIILDFNNLDDNEKIYI